jgi:hypothetical protein
VSILLSSFRAIGLALALIGASAIITNIALARDAKAMMLPVDAAPLVANTASGKQTFSIEIADDGTERERGLMFR